MGDLVMMGIFLQVPVCYPIAVLKCTSVKNGKWNYAYKPR
ncbi:hypothetical protein DFP98_101204 [Cohnella phaseoli]|uniref:Uncharacterized protein n=1 Tax=Cohnella phaseoli TaxID=456490 RepID=A0A3D9KSS8_9BACL|nr:hypothetical protein DFP98_101204 [Cohnella phaseoli]